MARQFVVKTIRWVRKYNVKLGDKGWLQDELAKINWKLGTHEKVSLFDGLFQVQHLKIIAQVPNNSCVIPVRDIIAIAKFKPSVNDVAAEDISFAKLLSILQGKKNSPYKVTDLLVYEHPDGDQASKFTMLRRYTLHFVPC
jgi:hypothetical protein